MLTIPIQAEYLQHLQSGMKMIETYEHNYPLAIVGAGGAGLRAALAARQEGLEDIAVISKVKPTRSPTTCAQGGIAAADEGGRRDSIASHIDDTLHAARGLADRDAVKSICAAAPEQIRKLDRLGVPFNRDGDNNIVRRKFAGHTHNNQPARRLCYFHDRTGHALLQTVHDHCRMSSIIDFYNEFFVLQLIVEDNRTRGLIAYNLADGSLHKFNSRTVILATGGCGELFSLTSNSRSSTGDGLSLALSAGVALQDMEFMQFHPTGVRKLGFLITEAARGLGGRLKNDNGERFMNKYAPEELELAPRDVVTRAIHTEIEEGRGIAGEDFVHLDLTDINDLEQKLPEVVSLSKNYLNLDPTDRELPVRPTAHYLMGGVPTDLAGRVKSTKHKGLYAAGETACLSLHGANRLGGNSLLEINVMGERAGKQAARQAGGRPSISSGNNYTAKWKKIIEGIKNPDGKYRTARLKKELKGEMTAGVGVLRTSRSMQRAGDKIKTLLDKSSQIKIDHRSKRYNYALVEALELKNMLKIARVLCKAAQSRRESRGSHWRKDYPESDDERPHKHSLVRKTGEELEVSYQPVRTGGKEETDS